MQKLRYLFKEPVPGHVAIYGWKNFFPDISAVQTGHYRAVIQKVGKDPADHRSRPIMYPAQAIISQTSAGSCAKSRIVCFEELVADFFTSQHVNIDMPTALASTNCRAVATVRIRIHHSYPQPDQASTTYVVIAGSCRAIAEKLPPQKPRQCACPMQYDNHPMGSCTLSARDLNHVQHVPAAPWTPEPAAAFLSATLTEWQELV